MFDRFVRSGALVIVLLASMESLALADYIEGREKEASSQALDVIVYDPQGRDRKSTRLNSSHRL